MNVKKIRKYLFWTECYCQNIFNLLYVYAYSYKWHKNKFLLANNTHVLFESFEILLKFKLGIFLIGISRITTSLMVYVMLS